MAKTVCTHCGYKNKGSVSVCSNCGYYLLDSQLGISASKVQASEFTGNARVSSYDAGAGPSASPMHAGRTIEIKSRTGIYKWLPTIVSIGPFVVFILLELFTNLPAVYFIPFLFVILFLSPVARRYVTGIRFFARGFSVRDAGRDEVFYYNNIESAKASAIQSGRQMLTMSLRDGGGPVSLEFYSANTYRMMLMQLKNRRIEVASDQPPSRDQTVA